MLTSLRIENFAIVAELELDFSEGLTAFTGETGAGKSIMIDALMLALGGRADASVIRNGAEKCSISACFHAEPSSYPMQWLREQEIDSEAGEIILRRVIAAEGRSKCYINGQLFPVQKLKELSEMLVDIHGQHQHQTLLQHPTHRQQLDQYANHHEKLQQIRLVFNQFQALQAELAQLEQEKVDQGEASRLQEQIDELIHLAVKPQEMQQLHEEHQLLHHACDYLEKIQQIFDYLNGEDHPNVCSNLNYALQLLASFSVNHAPIKNSVELLNSALIQCEEAINELQSYAKQIKLDPEKLAIIEERISELHRVARKYQVESNQLPELLQQWQERLARTHRDKQDLEHLKVALANKQQEYTALASDLTASRKRFAEKLAQEITDSIRQLGMPKGYVQIEITPLDKFYAHGMDKVEYKVCTNPGMLPDTLAKIVSGGELSRIGLAIHMITAKRASTPTLLFDEVDVGIGGATAALVGKLLRSLGNRLQVFCVTHQPQVAACAHHHFKVEKYTDDVQTFSQVIALQGAERIEEIGRMLGGLTITEQTRFHAKELLQESIVESA